MHELDVCNDLPEGIVKWDSPYLWKFKQLVNVEHFEQKFEAASLGSEGNGNSLSVFMLMQF